MDGYTDGVFEGAELGAEVGDIVCTSNEFVMPCVHDRPLRVPSPSTAKSNSYIAPATAAIFNRNVSEKVSLSPGSSSLVSPSERASYVPEKGLVTVAFDRLASNVPVFVAV